MTTMLFVLLPTAVAVALGLTWVLRRYALARRLIDIPNERSSHAIPTPRGGGMAIVVTFLGCLAVLWTHGLLPWRWLVAMLGTGGFVALIGFLDDHYHLPRRWRFLAHFTAAAWALSWLQGMPTMTIAGFELPANWLCNGIVAVYLVWLLNLYNFMDGIDGIASVEAITVCLGGVLLYLLVAPDSGLWLLPATLAAAVAGFLYWNYPPARIFMGDAGSGFLGMMLGILSIQAARIAPALLWSWIILLGVFIVDASVTLLRRMFAGGQTYLQAHRSHAYQFAARRCGAHGPVSLAVGAVNVIWLYPLAVLVALGYLDGLLGVLIAYTPLVGAAVYLKAGTASS